MTTADLNLGELSEEELKHISDVLSRDKKLHQSTNFIKIAIDNNNKAECKKNAATVNELVSAEIDRVKRLTPVSDCSGRNTPVPPISDAGEAAPSSGQGFFKSFAGMISRTIDAMDTKNKNADDRKTLQALAGATVKLNSLPKVPFSYNPRESIKRKRTLLELASTRPRSPERSVSAPGTRSSSMAVSQYHTSRDNSKFYSVPDYGSSTIPRNFGRVNLSTIPIPENVPARSPSVQNLAPTSRSPSLQALHTTPRNRSRAASPSPKFGRRINGNQPAYVSSSKSNLLSLSAGDEPLRFFPSPDSRESPDGANTHFPLDKMPSPKGMRHARSRSELDVKHIRQDPISVRSYDSGVASKSERSIGKNIGGGRSRNDTYAGRLSESESDIESDYDFDIFTNYDDNFSMASASSSTLDSPMRKLLTDCALDSGSETDKISPSCVIRGQILHTSPNAKPKSINVKGRDGVRNHKRDPSSGSASISLAPPLHVTSYKSLTLPASLSKGTRDAPMTASKIDSSNTIGNMEIAVVYYSADSLKSKNMNKITIPRNGTKSTALPNCHVLSRKEYNEVTDANLILDHSCPSGCPDTQYGELHVTIKGAKFQDHTGWNHTFVLAGFSQSELRQRSLEIVVGNLHFKKQEVFGGAVLSVGQGGDQRPWINSTKAEAYIWKTALQISGNIVRAFLPLRSNMKPTYL